MTRAVRTPTVATLPPELIEIQQRWLALGRAQQPALHASEFAAPFILPLGAVSGLLNREAS